jgi:hypothetical protein
VARSGRILLATDYREPAISLEMKMVQCANCGVELLQGQRFCRSCGAQVDGLVAPTQVMDADPDSPDSIIKVNHTARAPKADTNPVANPSNGQTTYIQAPQNPETVLMDSNPLPQHTSVRQGDANPAQGSLVQGQSQGVQASVHSTSPFQVEQPGHVQHTSADLRTTPPANVSARLQPKKSYGWLIAFGSIALVGVIFFAFLVFGYLRRASKPVTTPPPVTGASKEPTEKYLNEEAARVTDDETVFTQKFPLPNSAKFFLSHVRGDITVEGIDATEAEIKVIKRGGSAEGRSELKIVYSTLGGNLSLKPSKQFFNDDIEIVYEIKLPRNLGQVNIESVNSRINLKNLDALLTVKSVNGNLEMSNLRGAVRAETQSGEIFLSQTIGDIFVKSTNGLIEISGVSGSIKTDNTAGDTRATIDNTTSTDALSFESINGSIDLRFKSAINAELDANTISGSIDANGLGVEVKRSPGSEQAVGRLGIGGQALRIKTVSGDIKITRKS